jgi:hypothetical protein
VEALRTECENAGKSVHWRVFLAYDIEGPIASRGRPIPELAQEHGVPATQVTNYLPRCAGASALVLNDCKSVGGDQYRRRPGTSWGSTRDSRREIPR